MTAKITLARLKELAASVGIPEIGVTTVDPFPELEPWLEAYAARGRTGFEAESIEDRIDPSRWMPDAEMMIAVALPYLTDMGGAAARSHPSGRNHGQVSCYAYGLDYHQVLSQRLCALHAQLEAELGHSIRMKLSVDTSPLVERRVAERAGLGWIGKNSLFYSNSYGSFVFLGGMLVNFRIDEVASRPSTVADTCGTCEKCVLACPTGAILAPGVIDATRCLSYITQMKGIIPLEFRRKLGRRIWGCDICQWVCPENRDVSTSSEASFQPVEELAYPQLINILHLSNRQFMRQYRDTAVAWRGLRTLQRNALIVLGNVGQQEAVSEVIPFLSHPRIELRASAAWALGTIGGPDAQAALITSLANELEALVIGELQNALSQCGELAR